MSRIGDGPLNGTHYTREDDLAMVTTPSAWPLGSRLTVKRPGQFGLLVEGEGPVVHLRSHTAGSDSATTPAGLGAWVARLRRLLLTGQPDDSRRLTYGSWDELLDDGWVVD